MIIKTEKIPKVQTRISIKAQKKGENKAKKSMVMHFPFP